MVMWLRGLGTHAALGDAGGAVALQVIRRGDRPEPAPLAPLGRQPPPVRLDGVDAQVGVKIDEPVVLVGSEGEGDAKVAVQQGGGAVGNSVHNGAAHCYGALPSLPAWVERGAGG